MTFLFGKNKYLEDVGVSQLHLLKLKWSDDFEWVKWVNPPELRDAMMKNKEKMAEIHAESDLISDLYEEIGKLQHNLEVLKNGPLAAQAPNLITDGAFIANL
jgi:hypothetical protein